MPDLKWETIDVSFVPWGADSKNGYRNSTIRRRLLECSIPLQEVRDPESPAMMPIQGRLTFTYYELGRFNARWENVI